ncbi:MAG: hydrolase 2, exosortase A system-associated [Pseudomonadota bacterium]
MAEQSRGVFEPGFLSTQYGQAFFLTYPAVTDANHRAVLVLPAFAEEMNKCRRQVALTARALARAGLSVYLPDLIGTGDSDGNFGDATLAIWQDTLTVALDSIHKRGHSDVAWLCVRGGALLADGMLRAGAPAPSRMVLWQPVLSGKTMLSQFLRLKAMSAMTRAQSAPSVSELRKQLASGSPVEVAGYELNPALVSGVDALNVRQMAPVGSIDWLVVQDDEALPAAVSTASAAMADQHGALNVETVPGSPFWSTAEIAVAPELTRRTVELLGAA